MVARALILIFVVCVSLHGVSQAVAMEVIKYDSLHPEEKDELVFSVTGSFEMGDSLGKFKFGYWPFSSVTTSPFPLSRLHVVRGRVRDTSWANAYLLRVLPADFPWLTNFSLSGYNEKLGMGKDPILISFDEPVCAVGVLKAQSGDFNTHQVNAHRRKRTSIHFYDEEGSVIATFDQKPGNFMSKMAFQKDFRDPIVWAVAIESEVYFGIKEFIAMPCTTLLG